MTTPLLSTYVRNQTERRERQMQTAFPAKVLDWQSNTNTVRLEPQFVETWVTSDDQTHYEDVPDGDAYIDNVPVLFPRSGSWSITFPIEPGSFGMVICTKYSLDAFRNQGNRVDPGDLRRFTMSGAVFHPVNLYPNSSTLSENNTPYAMDPSFMILGQGHANIDFAARADRTNKEIDRIWYVLTTWIPGELPDSGAALKAAAILERGTFPDPGGAAAPSTACDKIKIQ
jgi:hypothetical protein